jgi:hypothetical protein
VFHAPGEQVNAISAVVQIERVQPWSTRAPPWIFRAAPYVQPEAPHEKVPDR